MEAEQQPFEVRGEVDQSQIAPTRDRLGIATGGAVLHEPVDVKKDEGSPIAYAGFVASPSLVHGVLDDPAGVSSTRDDDIEMKMEALLVAQRL